MTTRHGKLYVSDLMVDTVKKEIKNMHLGVYPPTGRIRVAAPLETSDEKIRLFVISRMSWIRKQQRRFLQQERQIERQYVAGESHYFFGDRYRLNIIYSESRPKIQIRKKTHIDLSIRANARTDEREAIFEKFYRSELRKLVPNLLERWQKKFGVPVNEVRIKKMKTKWGSCNVKARRIWLNSELAKKPAHCSDYVFVHELIHLIEKKHSQRFVHLMESALPNWQIIKDELNKQPLGYSTWKCQD
jgi:hypothetical protein